MDRTPDSRGAQTDQRRAPKPRHSPARGASDGGSHATRSAHSRRGRDLLLNAAEYRAWWEANAPVPYGFCWCGCGQKTGASATTNAKRPVVKGEPTRFLRGHFKAFQAREREASAEGPNPSGLCMCGCGGRTELATQTNAATGAVRGKPTKYLPYHQLKPKLTAEQEADICEWYRRGEGGDVIGRRHGVSPNTVYQCLERNGVERRPSTALNHLPEDKQDELRTRYQEGEGSAALAEAFGVSNVTVHNILRRRGIEAAQHYPLKAKEAEICERYQAGENTVELAEHFGVTYSAINRVLERNGVSRRSYSVTDEQAAEIHRRYEAGETVPSICRRIGIGQDAARNSLLRDGVELRKGNRRFTDEQEADIARRAREGEKVSELAEALGVGQRAVYGVLWRHGVKLGFSSVERQLSEADKDRVCQLYLSGAAPKNIGPEFGMSEMGVKGVLQARGVPIRSYSEAAKVASRPEDEAALRDRLAERLEREGYEVRTEVPMLAGGRCDILADNQNHSHLLIEVKIGKPLHGIGQLFGYRVGLEPRPRLVLAVSETWWHKSPGSSATFLRTACEEASVALWVVAEDGSPSNFLQY